MLTPDECDSLLAEFGRDPNIQLLRGIGLVVEFECFDTGEVDTLPGSVWLGADWWWADWLEWAGSYNISNAPWYYMGEEYGWWYVPDAPKTDGRALWQFAIFSHSRGGWFWIETITFPSRVYDLEDEDYLSF